MHMLWQAYALPPINKNIKKEFGIELVFCFILDSLRDPSE